MEFTKKPIYMYIPIADERLYVYSFPSLYIYTQMVPLIKKSSDVLVEKMGEFAESGKTVELFR